MNETPGIATALKILGWLGLLIGGAMIVGGFGEKSDTLILAGASAFGSSVFMIGFSVAIEKLSQIEYHAREIAAAAKRARTDSATV